MECLGTWHDTSGKNRPKEAAPCWRRSWKKAGPVCFVKSDVTKE